MCIIAANRTNNILSSPTVASKGIALVLVVDKTYESNDIFSKMLLPINL